MSGLEGRVAFISGVARGQGRAHAVRLAQDGADIIGFDICQDIPTMDYPNASEDDLVTTIKMVEAQGRRMVGRKADVRDYGQVAEVFQEGFADFGRVDIIIANAGIVRYDPEEDFIAEWKDVIDVNLTGPFQTVRAALPSMIEGGRGGSIVLTSSTGGLKGSATHEAAMQAYVAAKRGLVGYMQTLANDLAPHWIRANTIHPTGVLSGMTDNEALPRAAARSPEGIAAMQNALPIEILQPEDIANAVAFLVSDQARFITGVQWPLDAGFSVR